MDIGFNDNAFTWKNGQQGNTNIKERIDKCLANQQWRTLFPNVAILYIPSIASYHLPLLLNTEGFGHISLRPFKFEEMWIQDSSSFFTVANAWAMQVNATLLGYFQKSWILLSRRYVTGTVFISTLLKKD